MLIKHLKRTALLTCATLSLPLHAEITIEDAYVRATAPGQVVSASFMTLHNSASSAVTLLSASSDVAEAVELHNHVHEDSVMQMRQVEGINLPASGSVSLQPGGYHIMLIGLKHNLATEQSVAMSLKFSDGSEQTLNLPVKRVIDGLKQQGHAH